MLIKDRVLTFLLIQIREIMVFSKLTRRYLEIILGAKMSFFEPICNTKDKAMARIFVICRLMANFRVPSSSGCRH